MNCLEARTTMSIGGRKLSPLPMKTSVVLEEDTYSGSGILNTDEQEDKPLLYKETGGSQVALKGSSISKDVPELCPYGSCQSTENGKIIHPETKERHRSSAKSGLDRRDIGRKDTADFFREEVPTLAVSTTQVFPHSQVLSTDPSATGIFSRQAESRTAETSDVSESDANSVAAAHALGIVNSDKSNSQTKGKEEMFELQFDNNNRQKSPKLSPKYRSMSSSESGSHVPRNGAERGRSYVQRQQRWKDENLRAPLSRSQSHPLTTDETEYSQYWRGQVTIIETPDIALPTVQKKPSLEVDEQILATPIARAIVKGDHRLLLECLKQGENPNVVCPKTGKTYLHMVTATAAREDELKWIPMIFQLSNAGIDVNAKDGDGRSAARVAIMRRLVQVLTALLKCGTEVDLGDEYYAEQAQGLVKSELLEVIRRLTPSYWAAVHDLTSFKVSRLVKSWARVNISKKGQTLIEYAKQHAKEGVIVRLLLQHEASIELAHAVMAGDVDRVRVLLCNGAADLNTTDTSGKANVYESCSPLTLVGAAIKYGHSDMVPVLQEACSKSKTPKPTPGSSREGNYAESDLASSRSLAEGSPSKPLLAESYHYGSSNLNPLDVRSSDSVTSQFCHIL